VNKNTWRFAMLLVLIPTVALAAWQQGSHSHRATAEEDAVWAELIASMDKMDAAMASVKRSGDSDIDFVKLTTQYQVYLAESDHAPYGKLEQLAILKTNPDGGGIVQAIGPLKALAASASSSANSSKRFLIVTDIKDSSQVVLRQTANSRPPL